MIINALVSQATMGKHSIQAWSCKMHVITGSDNMAQSCSQAVKL